MLYKVFNKLYYCFQHYTMSFISLLQLFLFISLTYCNAYSQTRLRAGAAMVNITPPLGTVINGDFLPMYTKTIHDSLYVKALAFDNGKDHFVFVVADCMAMDGPLINEAKAAIKVSTGLLPSHVMISVTHSHSCGAVRGGAICPPDLAYRLSMPGKIKEAVKRAFANLKPAKIAWGHIDVPKYLSCRRWFMKPGFKTVNPFGVQEKIWMNPPAGSEYLDRPVSPTDPQVSYLAVKTMKNEWISIMANYSIHYAADIPENTISADYFGEVHRQLKSKLATGNDFVGIMTNGTSGDVNTTDFRLERNYPEEPYGKSRLIANDISDSIILSLQNAKFESKPVLKYAYKELPVGTRQPSDEQVSKAKEMVSNLDFSTLKSVDKASTTIINAYAIDLLELHEYQPDQIDLPIQAVRLGEGTIGSLPGEIFSETGLKLKKQAPSKYYFTVGLANAEVGYIPPLNQFELGGYETWLGAGSHMEISAEDKLSKALRTLVISVNKN
jgi:hypothetical protein